MAEIDFELAHFFAWARQRAYREFDERMKADPRLDPNWTFSEIMQDLLNEYRRLHPLQPQADRSSTQNSDE